MTAAWIAYALVVALLVAAAANGIETIVRSAGLPARWVWTAAIALLLVLVAVAPARSTRPSITVRPQLPTLLPSSCGESLSRERVDVALNGAGMLIVDGLRATHEQALATPASAIFSISLPQRSVTPAQLVEHYGPDAADGVAVVTTKAGDWRPASGTVP